MKRKIDMGYYHHKITLEQLQLYKKFMIEPVEDILIDPNMSEIKKFKAIAKKLDKELKDNWSGFEDNWTGPKKSQTLQDIKKVNRFLSWILMDNHILIMGVDRFLYENKLLYNNPKMKNVKKQIAHQEVFEAYEETKAYLKDLEIQPTNDSTKQSQTEFTNEKIEEMETIFDYAKNAMNKIFNQEESLEK